MPIELGDAISHLPAIACLLFLVGLLVGEVREWTWFRVVVKTSASASFLIYGVTSGAPWAGAAGVAVMVGLVLGAVGDIALLSRARPAFLLGLVSFLAGHVAYVVAFLVLGVSLVGVGLWAAILTIVAWRVWKWLGPHAGSMKGPVIAYIVTITVMVVCAAASVTEAPGPARAVLAVAAGLFFASDLAVARDRFVEKSSANRIVGLPLYYVAQLLFAGWIASA